MSQKKKQVEIPWIGMVSMEGITNHNEQRVLECLPGVLEEFPGFEANRVDIQDIYALSLNLLPARYRQAFSIVLQEQLSMDDVRGAVRKAVLQVSKHLK